MKMTNMDFKPAVIYARVSSKKQAKEGAGLESQTSRCELYAQSLGYEVMETFTDDMTGRKARRPGMDAMLTYLHQNKSTPHFVIIDDISRLARGLKAHMELRSLLSKAGGILKSPSIAFGEDSDSQMVEFILATVSQHFSQKNMEQSINRTTARLVNGYHTNSIPPAGYKYSHVDDNRIIRNEPLASIVQEALEGFASGRFGSKSEVRQFLQNQPEFPKNHKGEVTHERANLLLTQPTYAGMIQRPSWGISLREGKHEGLISYNTFLKIQDMLTEGSRVTNRIDIDQDFVLRGAVNCGDCEKPLTACWSKGRLKKYAYYLCFQKGCESYRKSIPRATLEQDFEDLLTQLQPSKTLFKAASRMFKNLWDYQGTIGKSRSTRLKSDIARLDINLTKLVDKMLDTNNDLVLARIETRITTLEKEKLSMQENIRKLGN